MPTWPASIPFFHSVPDMIRGGPQGAVLRSEMSIGPDKVRRRTSSAPARRDGRLADLSLAQLDTFEAFFRVTLGEGALSFDASDPFDGVTRAFRFMDSYEVRRSGRRYSVTAELEILP